MEAIREYLPLIIIAVVIVIAIAIGVFLKAAEHAFYQWLWGLF